MGTVLVIWFVSIQFRAVDPDPHGSAFIGPCGSGSAFKIQIRIQVEKVEGKNIKRLK